MQRLLKAANQVEFGAAGHLAKIIQADLLAEVVAHVVKQLGQPPLQQSRCGVATALQSGEQAHQRLFPLVGRGVSMQVQNGVEQRRDLVYSLHECGGRLAGQESRLIQQTLHPLL
ncbi:hypothetical protein D3C87_1475310 [compost metagenome]